ncbi:putative methionine-tRNA ligase isoform X1 [Capsicum annuum]|uniref:probable methionine--tRNA ligase isoform X1 n=1 Tax=Capsicum annuum TaxID=4072 RepID=UPI0007BF85E5|nr:probable methionine--tRNA ligase isoform X1 [Capsicum annuum]XP_047270802.1 probable methionine--tRNA ligase isoform X1 [Capsicum annuum]
MEKVKLKQGLKIAMSISGEGNGYLQESQFWKLLKEDRPLCSIVMSTASGIVYLLACLLDPFIPFFSREISVGLDGTSNKKVKLPKNFTLLGPGPGYINKGCKNMQLCTSWLILILKISFLSAVELLLV